MIDASKLRSEFVAKYGRDPRLFRAPGRVNLIGEHTDYNDGFVLPCALDFAACVAGAARDDRRIHVASLNFEHEFEFDLDDRSQPPAETWAKYVQGVALILERNGLELKGADVLIDSDVPIGAGLSSSAALEVSNAFALSALAGHKIDGMELAKIGQAAEHEFAGVRTGIMDQFASVFGKAGHALFLDCRSLEWSAIPVAGAEFIICDTRSKHDLAESEYNKRREECEAAAAFLGHASLRDVAIEELRSKEAEMPEVLRKRARHVITENARVLDSVHALRAGDLIRFGQLMNESHESLQRDFEVSSRELDVMVDLARERPGVLGARMTGGGFGGCTINLLGPDSDREFAAEVSSRYMAATSISPNIYRCVIADGVSEITPK